MTDTFIDVDDLEWKTAKINRYIQEGPIEKHKYRFELELFEPYASWDALDMWEDERLESMQKHIKQGDVLFEVGAEMGLFPAIFSKYMTENVVLIEPTAEFWPGIKAIYERNQLKNPLLCWWGFVDDVKEFRGAGKEFSDNPSYNGFPEENELIDYSQVIEKRKYQNLFDDEDYSQTPAVALDRLCASTDTWPDHISIDVEGAELLVLKGAEQTLKEEKPLVWVSIHPDMLESLYGQSKEDVLFFMDDCGYDCEILAVDHETHAFFTPKEI